MQEKAEEIVKEGALKTTKNGNGKNAERLVAIDLKPGKYFLWLDQGIILIKT